MIPVASRAAQIFALGLEKENVDFVRVNSQKHFDPLTLTEKIYFNNEKVIF